VTVIVFVVVVVPLASVVLLTTVVAFGVITTTLTTKINKTHKDIPVVVVVPGASVEIDVVDTVEKSVSVEVKLTVVVEKTVLVYNVAVGLRLYCCGVQGSKARFSRFFVSKIGRGFTFSGSRTMR
jgi:hypothetical protein